MAPSQRNVIALLGLVASARTAPAPAPQVASPSNQIGLQPPSYSVSWDLPAPLPTAPPSVPGQPETTDPGYSDPIPAPSDQISLYPPSYSVSWDTGSAPAPTDEPEPGLPDPTPSDQISLNPPSYSVSWDLPPTKAPWTPNPTKHTGHHTHHPSSAVPPYSYSATWEATPPANTGGLSWDLPQSTTASGDSEPTLPPASLPSDETSLVFPTPSVTWNKRAEVTLTNSWGFRFTSIIPSASRTSKYTGDVSWFKRQDGADPTSDPGDDLPPPFTPTPSNDIGIQPPSATISWGKREPAESNSFWLGNPSASIHWPRPPKTSAYISWGKRQEDGPEPTSDPADDLPPPALETPPDEISFLPPSASIIWGRDVARPTKKHTQSRKPVSTPSKSTSPSTPEATEDPQTTDDPQPTDDPSDSIPPPAQQTPPDQISLNPPSATVIWGREVAKPTKKTTKSKKASSTPASTKSNSAGLQFPSYSVVWPKPPVTSAYVSWGKREAAPQSNDVGIQPPTESVGGNKEKRTAEPDPQYTIVFPSGLPISWDPENPPWGPQPSKPYISWGKRGAVAEPTAAPNANEERAAEAEPQWLSWGQPRPSPPSWVSWGRDAAPEPTAAPVLEEKREAEAEPQWFSLNPENPQLPPWWPKPSSPNYVSWGKRDGAPEPTAAPVLDDKRAAEAEPQWFSLNPENPQLPPWWPKPSSPNYVSWGKRDDAPAPTAAATLDEKRDAEPEAQWLSWDPENPPYPPWWPRPSPSSPAFVSWGKRDEAPEPTAAPVLKEKRDAEADPQWSLLFPSGFLSWDPSNPWWPKPSAPAYVSWGKRDATPEPTAAAILIDSEEQSQACASTTTLTRVRPCPLVPCDIACPVRAHHTKDTYDISIPGAQTACPITATAIKHCLPCDCGLPTPVPIELRDDNIIPTPPPYTGPSPSISLSLIAPTTFSRHTFPGHTPSPTPTPTPSYSKPISQLCPDVTKTIIPPCIPPYCPVAAETPCDFNRPIPKMEKVRREPKIVSVTIPIREEQTYSIGKPTPVAPSGRPSTVVGGACTTARTVTVNVGCPTYTCVPGGLCDPYQVIR